MEEVDTGPAAALGAGAVVLLHTLPPGPTGMRAEEAAFRQYNSCVDFTFQERRGNARKLKRLNAIFERAADRRSGGIREDKLLRILPSGTAPKYGIDPAAVKRRLQARREWQEEQKRILSVLKSKRRRKKRRDRNGASDGRSGADDDVVAILGPCPELRVLSRGTFLAMFANETTTFVNTMGQNERADRERKLRRSGSSSGANGPSNNSTPLPSSSRAAMNNEQRQQQQQQLPKAQPQRQQIVMVAEPEQHSPPSTAPPHSLPVGVLGEMTNAVPLSNSGQQLLPTTASVPSAESGGSEGAALVGVEEKALRTNRSRSSRRGRKTASPSAGGERESEKREKSSTRRNTKSRRASGGRRKVKKYDVPTDDGSISSLSTMGSYGSGSGGGRSGLDKQRMDHRRVDSLSSLSSAGEPFVAPGLQRSLSHDQNYFSNEVTGGGNALSPDSCNSSLACSDSPSPRSISPFPVGGMPPAQTNSLQQPHHSADAAAGGWSSPSLVEKEFKSVDPNLDEQNELTKAEQTKAEPKKKKSDPISSRNGRRKTSRSDKAFRSGPDDNGSLGNGSYQSGGKLIGQSPSKEERRALRRERRRRKEEQRRVDVQRELQMMEQRQRELQANQRQKHHTGMPFTGIGHPGRQQPPPPQFFGEPIQQRGVYNCETIREDEQDCVFFASVSRALRTLIPSLGGNKKAMVGIAPTSAAPKQASCVAGFAVSGPGMHGFGQIPGHVAGHRRAASLNIPAIMSNAHQFYARHQRTKSMDGRLPSNRQRQHQLVGMIPFGAATTTTVPELSGAGVTFLSGKPNIAPTTSSATHSSRSASPIDLQYNLPNILQALGRNDADFRHFASTASFSSVSSHSTNGSAPLAGEFVVIQ